MVFEGFHNVRYGRSLLSNSNVNAVKSLFGVNGGIIKGILLVDNGVNSNGSLSSLSVTNDQFSLTSTDGDLRKVIRKLFKSKISIVTFIII